MIAHRSRSTGGVPVTFAALLAGLFFALPAAAATYYVSNSGSDSNSGTSPGSAWATIGKANSRVAPGDVVLIEDGAYGHFPNPAVSGTATARITYVGNLTSPSSVRITSGNALTKSNVTIKGFELANGFDLTGHRDSIAFCKVYGTKSQITGADDCVVTRCDFVSLRFWVVGAENESTVRAERDTVSYCTFQLDPNDGSAHVIRFQRLENCVFNHLRFIINIGPEGRRCSATKLFMVTGSQFTDCYWDVTNNRLTDADEAGWFVLRDITQFNRFVRDTIILRGPGDTQFFGAASGSYPGTTGHNYFEDCIIKSVGPAAYGHAWYYQDDAESDTLRRCLIVGRQGGMKIINVSGNVLMDHCTIASFAPWTGALHYSAYSGTTWQGQLKLENSILYTVPTAPKAPKSASLYVETPPTEGHFQNNYNLFFGGNRPDSSIYATYLGPSGPGGSRAWCTSKGQDCQSVHGDPRFADISSVEAFDARLQSGSWASGTGRDGVDIGAYAFTGPDVTPPSTVADAAVAQIGDNFVTVQWTAPGDDGVVGRATAYDVRWALAPINESNFSGATSAPNPPTPQSSGSLESFPVPNLTPGQTYYFAIRARDEAGNWGTAGNAVVATTHPSDITPPGTIRDLRTGQ